MLARVPMRTMRFNMLGIKKLHILIFKQFALLFIGTFFISLFVLMMQFVWRYIDTLIGKGLSLDVLAQFFCKPSDRKIYLEINNKNEEDL